MPKVSVIVPVYNAEKYIERCARSLFEQTLDDIEYIFVNDCTPDNSIKILNDVLKEYPHRESQVRIFNHGQNQGQAGARTTGMKAMTGEYMIHCDPDDWVDIEMYKIMYNNAIKQNYDIVVCNFYTTDGNNIIKNSYARSYYNSGIQTLIKYNFWCSLWNNLIKTTIIKKYEIYPYNGVNYGEDLNTLCRALFYSNKILYLENEYLYYYFQNDNSISHVNYFELFKKYTINNINNLDEFYKGQKLPELFRDRVKFNAKTIVLSYSSTKWATYWPECHKNILKMTEIPFKYRCLYYAGSYIPYILKIYYKFLQLRGLI